MGKADLYNQSQLQNGEILPQDLTVLARFWQKHHGLKVDGMLGPKTLISVSAASVSLKLDIETDPMLRALVVAASEIGNGETEGNNRGPAIYRYRAGDGTGKEATNSASWCASFVSYCLLKANKELPFETSRGAKRLVSNCARAGREVSVPIPGALIAWHRLGAGGVKTWRGHVGIIEKYDSETDTLYTIEGNKNTKGRRFAYVDRFDYQNGAWRDKLARIATLSPL